MGAVIIADSYVRDVLAGQSLVVVPAKQMAVKTAYMPESAGPLLTVRTVPSLDLVLPEKPELFSAQDTNVGHLAGFMSGVLKKQAAATVGSMGDKATSNTLKATL